MKVMLVVETLPGQGQHFYPASYELRKQLLAGCPLPPHFREATQDELLEYIEYNGVLSQNLGSGPTSF